MDRAGVVTVAQLRALVEDEERLRMIPNLGPMSLADISQALTDPALGLGDPIEMLALPAARPIRERNQELIRMRQQGASLGQVARRFGISRTRVEQILERDGW